MTDDEIRTGILRVCKVASWDSDFNIVRFHTLCDKLKELGAAAEREACETACDRVYHQHIGPQFGEVRYGIAACKDAIRARGNI